MLENDPNSNAIELLKQLIAEIKKEQSSRSIGYGINEDASWSEVAPDAWGMEGES